MCFGGSRRGAVASLAFCVALAHSRTRALARARAHEFARAPMAYSSCESLALPNTTIIIIIIIMMIAITMTTTIQLLMLLLLFLLLFSYHFLYSSSSSSHCCALARPRARAARSSQGLRRVADGGPGPAVVVAGTRGLSRGPGDRARPGWRLMALGDPWAGLRIYIRDPCRNRKRARPSLRSAQVRAYDDRA